MELIAQSPALDGILEDWRECLGGDYLAYRNHCYRVLNFCLAFSGESPDNIGKASIAAACHDLGIWADSTYDYIAPSLRLAREYLGRTGQGSWSDEIEAMIALHHKVRSYKANAEWLVEPFRKADWVDVTRGRLRFGLPAGYVAQILEQFPNAGFHKRLAVLGRQRLKTHPFNPLPMLRW